jgi:hypothetical protein
VGQAHGREVIPPFLDFSFKGTDDFVIVRFLFPVPLEKHKKQQPCKSVTFFAHS